MIRYPFAILAILISPGLAHAQKRSDARAEAKAESSDNQKTTTTHRVVVVNGKKTVDEKTVNGKRVPSHVGGVTPGADPEAMLRELRERMRREMGRGVPGGDTEKVTNTHKRRVVKRNGEVIVDEETRNGKPVRRDSVGGSSGLGRDRARKLEARKLRKVRPEVKSGR
jgi:hypothetical protein